LDLHVVFWWILWWIALVAQCYSVWGLSNGNFFKKITRREILDWTTGFLDWSTVFWIGQRFYGLVNGFLDWSTVYWIGHRVGYPSRLHFSNFFVLIG